MTVVKRPQDAMNMQLNDKSRQVVMDTFRQSADSEEERKLGIIPATAGASSDLSSFIVLQNIFEHWQELVDSRDFLYTWTMRELKVRYAGSLLGFAWALLYPLTLLLISVVVFDWFLRVPTSGVPAALFLYCGLAPWLFSSGTIQNSAFALHANLPLVKNVCFPREVLPLATVLVGLVDWMISAVLLMSLIVYYRLPVGAPILLVPVLMVIQFALTLAVCLFVSAALVFYRDVRFLVPIAMQFLMYLSPVFYPIDVVPQKQRSLYLLNPFAGLIDGYRKIILFRTWPDWKPIAWAAMLAIITLLISYIHFKTVEGEFADRI